MKTNTLRNSPIFRFIAYTVLTAFAGMLPVNPSYAQVAIIMPPPGQMIHITRHFEPPQMVGLKVNLKDPFSFDFIMDQGEKPMSADIRKQEFNKIIKYFLVSLAMPNTDMWVNLSPYESKRIIPEVFAQTEMGRDLLAQDYILKQFTASLMYPEDGLGKKFWDNVYSKAQARFGTTEISVNTFNKVWIVADHADVYQKGDTAFLVGSHLKVMLEQDYMAIEKNKEMFGNTQVVTTDETKDAKTQMASQLVREIIIPAIEKEVNEGKSFAAVRQVYNAEIMATWFKRALKQSLLGQVFANKSKIAGQRVKDPQAEDKIYQQYLRAYKKGVFNYVREDATPDGQMIPRKYFSGGLQPLKEEDVITFRTPNKEVKDFAQKTTDAAMLGHIFRAMTVFLVAGSSILFSAKTHAQTTQQSGLWTASPIEVKAFHLGQNETYKKYQDATKKFFAAEKVKDSVNMDFWQNRVNDYGTQIANQEDSAIKQIQAELAAPGVGVVDNMQWVLPLIQKIQNSTLDENFKRNLADGVGEVAQQLFNFDHNAYKNPGAHVEALVKQLKGYQKEYYAAEAQQKVDQQNALAAEQNKHVTDSLDQENAKAVRKAQEARALYLTSQQSVQNGTAYNFQITPMYGNFTPEPVHVTLTSTPVVINLIQQMQELHLDTARISRIRNLSYRFEQARAHYTHTLEEGVKKDQDAIKFQNNTLRLNRTIYYADVVEFNKRAKELKDEYNADQNIVNGFESQMHRYGVQINNAKNQDSSAKILYVQASTKETIDTINLNQTQQRIQHLSTTINVSTTGISPIGFHPSSSTIGVVANSQIGPSKEKLEIMSLKIKKIGLDMKVKKDGEDRTNKKNNYKNTRNILNTLYATVGGKAKSRQLPGLTPEAPDTIRSVADTVTRELAQETSVNGKNHIVANGVLDVMLLLNPNGVESGTFIARVIREIKELRRIDNSPSSWLFYFQSKANQLITEYEIAKAERLRALQNQTRVGVAQPATNNLNPVGAVTPSLPATNATNTAVATTATATPTHVALLLSKLDEFERIAPTKNLGDQRLQEVTHFIAQARTNLSRSDDIHRGLGANQARVAGRYLGVDLNIDFAMKAVDAKKKSEVGGINLSDKNLVINIKVDGAGMPLPAQFQNKAMMNLEGLTSVIRKITPLAPENIPALYDLVR